MATGMRADARRNREQILRAARAVFVAEGPDAPLDEIARRAGVGIATLYRRFPTREDLIRAVGLDTMAEVGQAAREAMATEPEPFQALRRFAHRALTLKIGAVMPTLSGRIPVDDALYQARGGVMGPVQQMISRAQAAGVLRRDVAFSDIPFMIIRLTRPLPGGGFPEDGALAHRQLELYLDGLRPGAAHDRGGRPLPGPVVSPERFERITDRMVSGSSPEGDPRETTG